MHRKELLLQAGLARVEAAQALNPHVRNAFFHIQRWYERLAAIELESVKERQKAAVALPSLIRNRAS